MKLATMTVSFPVVEVESTVQIQVPRLPTVFERMVLRLCGPYQNHPELRNMTFLDVFQNRMGVSDAQTLVGPCLEELMMLGVLENPRSDNPMTVPLAGWKLTELGHSLWLRKQLPGWPRDVSVTHIYDPLRDKLEPANDGAAARRARLTPQPQTLHFEAEDFAVADLSSRVQGCLPTEKHDWWQSNIEVSSVRSNVVGTLWRNCEVQLDCDSAGVLSLCASGSSDIQSWLGASDAELVWQRVLSLALTAPHASDRRGDLHGAQAVWPLTQDADADDKVMGGRDVVLRVTCGQAEMPKVSGDLWIHLSPVIDEVKWRPQESGPDEPMAVFPLPVALSDSLIGLTLSRPGARPQAVTKGFATLFWAGQPRDVRLAMVRDEQSSREIWAPLCAALESALYSQPDPALAAIPALWAPPETVMTRWLSRMQTQPLLQLLSDGAGFQQALIGRLDTSDREWQPAFQRLLNDAARLAAVHLGAIVSSANLVAALKALKALGMTDVEDLQTQLLERLSPLEDLDSIRELRAALGERFEFPITFFAESGLRALLEDALSSAKLNLCGPHAFERCLVQTRIAYDSVVRDIGVDAIDSCTEDVSSASWLGILRRIRPLALHSAKSWREASEGFRLVSKGDKVWVGTKLERTDKAIKLWQSYFARFLLPALPDDRLAVVLDANTLMDFPDLVGQMAPGELAVVPKSEMDLLVHLAQDKENAQAALALKAQLALQRLELARVPVRCESADLGLMPADWVDNHDNRILAVALRFRLSRVTLLTSDQSLRKKASAERLDSSQPLEYLKKCNNQQWVGPRGNVYNKRG